MGDLLTLLQQRLGLAKVEAAQSTAAAVLAPICASLPASQQEPLLALLPPSLARAILLQQPTTAAYANLDRYVSQVANQEGIRREQAIVHIAGVLLLLGERLPSSLRAALAPDLAFLLGAA